MTPEERAQKVRDHMKQELKTLAVFLPEQDTRDRALFRVELMIDLGYDRSLDPEEADQPVRDLLTDLVHYCAQHGVDIRHALERAEWMAEQDLTDWGIPTG